MNIIRAPSTSINMEPDSNGEPGQTSQNNGSDTKKLVKEDSIIRNLKEKEKEVLNLGNEVENIKEVVLTVDKIMDNHDKIIEDIGDQTEESRQSTNKVADSSKNAYNSSMTPLRKLIYYLVGFSFIIVFVFVIILIFK